MYWVFLFIISWILFFLLIDFKKFKYCIWSGFFSITIQLFIDTHAFSHGCYEVLDPVLSIWGSSLFFVIGPVFVIGTLMAQYSPSKRWLRVFSVLVFSLLYTLQEILLLMSDVLVYKNWSIIGSIIVNIFAMISISWFSIVILQVRKESIFR